MVFLQDARNFENRLQISTEILIDPPKPEGSQMDEQMG